MSNSNENLGKCSRCENLQLIISFNKDKNRKDGLYPQSKICREKYYNLNQKPLYDNKNFFNDQNREKKNHIIFRNNRRNYLSVFIWL